MDEFHRCQLVKRAVNVLRPSHVLSLTLSVYAIGLMLAPVVPVGPIHAEAMLLWIICCAAAYVGSRIFDSGPAPQRLDDSRAVHYLRLARRTVGLGLVGVVSLLLDRYVMRGAPMTIEIFAVREIIEESSATLFSSVAALLGAFAPFALITVWTARYRGARISQLITLAALIVVIGYVAFSVAAGSRSILLVVAVIHATALLYFRRRRGKKTGVRQVLVAALAAAALILLGALIMLWRLQEMGLDPMISLQVSSYAQMLQPSPWVLDRLETMPEIAPLLAAIFSLALYVFHGLFEFSELVQFFADQHTYGAQLFWLPVKLFSMVTGFDMSTAAADLAGVRSGIFTTLVGPLFIDFGWLTPLFMFGLFAVLALPSRYVSGGDERWLPLALTVVAVVILFPVMSLLESAAGMYLIVAGVLLPALHGRRRSGTNSHGPLQRSLPFRVGTY